MIQEKHRATIGDIAQVAGVSKTTVSRYINGKSDLMTEETRERIRLVIEMMDYKPNSAARRLRTNRSKQIGVLLADMETPFSSALAVGIGDALQKYGYAPLFVDCRRDLLREVQLTQSFLEQQVDGLLVNSSGRSNPELIRIACGGFPVVLLDRFIKDYNFSIVTVEQEKCILEMIRHLSQQGYTRPMLFTEPVQTSSTRLRRRDAFLNAVQSICGYDAQGDIYVVDDTQAGSIQQQVTKALDSLRPGDVPAILGVNSTTTVRVYSTLCAKGLRIPEDVGLCGPEDWDWTSEMNWPQLLAPGITSIYVPTKIMGYRAAELLVNMIEDSTLSSQQLTLDCELRIRRSTLRKP